MRRRRASCADVGTPLSSVSAASGDRSDEAQQRDEAIGGVPGEAVEERCRQMLVIDRRHEHGAGNLPERCCREALAPPPPPALDGAAIDADGLREAVDPRCRHAVAQNPHQHHDGGEIDLAAKEAQRWRRRPRPAAVHRTAEAEAPVVLGAEPAGPAARLARITGRMQRAAATHASPGTRRVGEIGIAGEQQLMECGVGQQVSIQRCVLPASMVPTNMAKPTPKPGRNDPCHCGSGNKYKKCCLTKDEAAERDRLVKAQAQHDKARHDERAATDPLHVAELTAAIAAHLARAEEEDAYEDELDAASNAVVDLVRAAKLDEAEAAARDLLLRFPDVHDGWDRLGMVHEARGNSRQAADCYRKVIDFIRHHPDRYDAGMVEHFAKLVERLDPPVAS